jgi:hypothetical protein
MLSCCHYGVMMYSAIVQSNTINISTCIWLTQTFRDAYFNRNILSTLYQRHLTHPLPSSCLQSWMILCSYIFLIDIGIMISYATIRATHANPIHCFKADTHSNVRVILRVPELPANNPQQSKEASRMGGNTNCKSRKSTKGGPSAVTESNEGYHELYTVSSAILSTSFFLT